MRRPLMGACLFFVLLLLSFYVCVPVALPEYGALDGKELSLTGEIVQIETKEYFDTMNIVYTLKDVQVEESMADGVVVCYEHDQIYCYTSELFENTYIGSKIAVKGDFSSFKGAENPGSFDSRLYYHILGVGGSLKDTQLISTDGAVSYISDALHRLRLFFIQKTSQLFSEPYSGIVQAVLLGYKGNLDADIKQLYKEGGMLHIMTISGMHISMLGMGCVWVLKKLRVPGRTAAMIGAVVVVLYGLMIGMQVATMRAVIMFCMRMLAKLLGRTYDAKTALGLSAVVLLLREPMYLFSSGFLLSYGSVLGMIVVTPVLNKVWACKNKFVQGLFARLMASTGILLATLPIQLYFFYEYSLYSILINSIVLPFLPYVVGIAVVVLVLPMPSAGAIASTGAMPSVLAMPLRAVVGSLVWLDEWILRFFEGVCQIFREMPAHTIVAGAPKLWQIIVYYVVLSACLVLLDSWVKRKRLKEHQKGVVCLVGVLTSALLLLFWRPLEGLQCHFLSVGQGDCAVLREGTRTYLVDCGSSSKKGIAEDVLLPFLKYYGVSEVVGVFLSHADEDHINGIMQWLEDYEHSHVKIKSVVLPALAGEMLQEEFGEVLALCKQRGVPVFTVGEGDRFSVEKLKINVLSPSMDMAQSKAQDSNECSQVLLLEYESCQILFTGDISSKTEADLIRILKEKPINILKVAHHGSKYSSSEAFLGAIKPQIAILSYGEGNSYGHPHKEVLERLNETQALVIETAKCGAVKIVMDGEIEITTFLK